MIAAVSAPSLALSREALLCEAQALPAAPQVLGSLCELLEETNASAAEIADLIRVDPALAARVLRTSNSIVFRGHITVSSIEDAVTRVGIGEMTRLIGAATVTGLFDRNLSLYRVPAERLRESLLMHALASEALARFTTVEPRTAYAGGLLRAVGMMVLDRVARTKLAAHDSFDSKRHATYNHWELARFGLTSVELTAILLEEWRFPAALVAAMDQHTQPEDSELAYVLNLAGAIVAAHGLALPGDFDYWILSGEKFSGARVGESELHEASEQARIAFKRHRSALY